MKNQSYPHLPTIMTSFSLAFFLNRFHRSSVKSVLPELNMEVKEDINAANMAASITPLNPTNEKESTSHNTSFLK